MKGSSNFKCLNAFSAKFPFPSHISWSGDMDGSPFLKMLKSCLSWNFYQQLSDSCRALSNIRICRD